MQKCNNLLLTLFCLILFSVNAQDTLSINKSRLVKNNLCIELGGTGILYSINYERNFQIRTKFYQSVKMGINRQAYVGIDQVLIPIDYNFYLGKGYYKFLLGAGVIGLIGTNTFPGSYNSRLDYKNLYNSNTYNAITKYGNNKYEQAFDVAYTAKIGCKYIGKYVDLYSYLNCFYIRFSTQYNLKPVWFCLGISFKLRKPQSTNRNFKY